MNETPFGTFIALINFDRDILALESELKKLDKEIAVIKENEKKLEIAMEATRKASHAAQKLVDLKELDMKTLDEQEKIKKNRLENVTNHKEYQSVKAELDQIKTKQQTLEKDLLEAWAALEQQNNNREQQKIEHEKQRVQVQEQLASLTQQRSNLADQISEKLKTRHEKEKNVPAEWIEKYVAMRSRVPNPVVPVVKGSCSACYYKVSDQDMILLSRNRLLQCKDCYRFLYIESPEHKNIPS